MNSICNSYEDLEASLNCWSQSTRLDYGLSEMFERQPMRKAWPRSLYYPFQCLICVLSITQIFSKLSTRQFYLLQKQNKSCVSQIGQNSAFSEFDKANKLQSAHVRALDDWVTSPMIIHIFICRIFWRRYPPVFAAADRNLTQHHNLPRQWYTDKYLGAGACKRYLNNKISVDRKKDTPFL